LRVRRGGFLGVFPWQRSGADFSVDLHIASQVIAIAWFCRS
jgi:hypothetical protein